MRALLAAVVLAGGLAIPANGQQPIVADLSDHLIGITTGFTGADVVLFGTVEAPGDIRVVVTGPNERVTVRRKARIAGIWINTDAVVFPRVPSFRAVAASRALGPGERLPIGIPPLELEPATPMPADNLAAYQSALIRSKQRSGLYAREERPVAFLGSRLFRTNLHFPANVPTGIYSVQVFFVRDGEVASAQTTPLNVSKVGFSADVFAFARDRPMGYGGLAVIVAVAAGWIGATLLRRV